MCSTWHRKSDIHSSEVSCHFKLVADEKIYIYEGCFFKFSISKIFTIVTMMGYKR